MNKEWYIWGEMIWGYQQKAILYIYKWWVNNSMMVVVIVFCCECVEKGDTVFLNERIMHLSLLLFRVRHYFVVFARWIYIHTVLRHFVLLLLLAPCGTESQSYGQCFFSCIIDSFQYQYMKHTHSNALLFYVHTS